MSTATDTTDRKLDARSDELPLAFQVGITPSGRRFAIRVPVRNAEGITFPLGMALVECYADDGRRLYARLTPVVQDDRKAAYVGAIDLHDWLPPHAPTDRLSCSEVTTIRESVLKRITPKMMGAYAARRFVRYHPGLQRGLRSLQRVMRESKRG